MSSTLFTDLVVTISMCGSCTNVLHLFLSQSHWLSSSHHCQWCNGWIQHNHSEFSDNLPVSAATDYSISTKLSVWRRWEVEPRSLPSGVWDDSANSPNTNWHTDWNNTKWYNITHRCGKMRWYAVACEIILNWNLSLNNLQFGNNKWLLHQYTFHWLRY